MKRKKIYFVSGIDTGAGKSIATGWLAARWREQGVNVITQKPVETGCGTMSEDIAVHRRLMGIGLLPEDMDGTTCPQRFAFPASPDLAARLEGRSLDFGAMDEATRRLAVCYDTVLVEGAGGLMVPLCDGFRTTTLDYIAERTWPVILVTNPRLGSVNHTLLSLEACRNRGVEVEILIYNRYHETASEITVDTRQLLQEYIAERLPRCEFIEIPDLSGTCSE
ncbi:MAG: dethiobiotin synthase [Rikenellaceae bacterium]|nr:dethiobiotin synthase [Rikenellaceae bacterium]MCL2692573.1 dethiobiotin synthase [Rikenellaceae bacterium]